MKKIRDRLIKGLGIIGIILLLISGVIRWKTVIEKSGELVFAAGTEWVGTAEEDKDKTESETENESESETENESESETESETESEIENESEIAGSSGTGAEKLAESESESATEPVSENTGEQETEELSETTTEESESTESESEIATEPTSENESEQESEELSETTTEESESTESESEPTTEPVSENEIEQETEELSETTTEESKSTESESEPATEPVSENEIEQETEELSETMTEESTESESESVSETSTEFESEPTTERKELLPEHIERGKHYEVKGDIGAWHRDTQGNLWLRKGTNLYIETKQEGGYDGRGTGMKNLQSDGVMTFQLQKTDSSGKVLAVSELCRESFYVDGEAPEAVILAEGTEKDGLLYQTGTAYAQIAIAPDGKSGLKKAEYCLVECQADGSPVQDASNSLWQSCENGQQIAIQEEGIYTIYVRTQDQVGNQCFSQSVLICVDQTSPDLVIEGVRDQTANADTVEIRISCNDPHYKKGSLNIQLTGANAGKRPAIKEQEESEQGATVTYLDFPKVKTYDDIYKLEAAAEDLAGNQIKKSITFSVNRFGSVYDLSEDTKKGLKQYYLKAAQPIVFYETNIDYVGESEILCRRDGQLSRLKRGNDYQVVMQGSSSSWKRYQYVIPETYFSEEGIYELMLSSKDKAQNESDTGQQEKRVVFVLDWTAPQCSVTGISAGEVYNAESVTVCMVPYDNFNIAGMRIYKDSELLKVQKADNQEPIRLRLEAEEQWQTLQVYLCDQSGNEYWSKEIPFYIRKNGEEVQPYEKVKESAEEKERRKKLGEWNLLNRFPMTVAQNLPMNRKNLIQTKQILHKTDSKTNQENRLMQETNIQKTEKTKQSGTVLLAVGIVIFLLTVFVLFWHHFRLL